MSALAKMPDTQITGPSTNPLRIFTKAPFARDMGVVVVEHDGLLLKAGEVAVYDRCVLQSEEGGLVDGGLYAIEYQSPIAGMDWKAWWGDGTHTRSRLQINRGVIILRRHHRIEGSWTLHPIASRDTFGCYLMSDGPIPEWLLYDKLLGRIVGIYNPAALPG
jgi:hypothetical protein